MTSSRNIRWYNKNIGLIYIAIEFSHTECGENMKLLFTRETINKKYYPTVTKIDFYHKVIFSETISKKKDDKFTQDDLRKLIKKWERIEDSERVVWVGHQYYRDKSS